MKIFLVIITILFQNLIFAKNNYFDFSRLIPVQNEVSYWNGKIEKGEIKIPYKNSGKTKAIANFLDNGYIDGKVTSYHPNGEIKFIAFYKKGYLHGEVKYYYDNGNKKEILNYLKGKKENCSKLWFKTGVVKEKRCYKNNKLHGCNKVFNKNSSLKSITSFKNGYKESEADYKNNKLDGKLTYYYPNGNKKTELNYKNGILDGKLISYYKNGYKKSESDYKSNKLDGKLTYYYLNHNKKTELNYKNGILNGKLISYYKNGYKEKEYYFSQGMRSAYVKNYENVKKVKFIIKDCKTMKGIKTFRVVVVNGKQVDYLKIDKLNNTLELFPNKKYELQISKKFYHNLGFTINLDDDTSVLDFGCIKPF